MTYAELYERVKPELEAAKKPFKEYKKERKTFSELFNENQEEEKRFNECKTFNEIFKESQIEIEPLTEQEAIYIVAKLESGEKLTESEIQKLDEVGGFSLGQNIRGGLANLFNKNGAYAQAYNNQKKLNKQNKKNLQVNKYQNQFANSSNEWLKNKAQGMGYETDANGQIINPAVQQTTIKANKLKQTPLVNAEEQQATPPKAAHQAEASSASAQTPTPQEQQAPDQKQEAASAQTPNISKMDPKEILNLLTPEQKKAMGIGDSSESEQTVDGNKADGNADG